MLTFMPLVLWIDGDGSKKIVERRANMAEGSMEGDHEITAADTEIRRRGRVSWGGGGGNKKYPVINKTKIKIIQF
jgi:hypothetical protein